MENLISDPKFQPVLLHIRFWKRKYALIGPKSVIASGGLTLCTDYVFLPL